MNDPLGNCTAQEQRIIAVLRDQPDATNAEIAVALGKSARTVENQLRRLYQRLGLKHTNRRAALVALIFNRREDAP